MGVLLKLTKEQLEERTKGWYNQQVMTFYENYGDTYLCRWFQPGRQTQMWVWNFSQEPDIYHAVEFVVPKP